MEGENDKGVLIGFEPLGTRGRCSRAVLSLVRPSLRCTLPRLTWTRPITLCAAALTSPEALHIQRHTRPILWAASLAPTRRQQQQQQQQQEQQLRLPVVVSLNIRGTPLPCPNPGDPTEPPLPSHPLRRPAQVSGAPRCVLGTGSLHLAGGDGTFVTFLAYGHHIQAAGSLPVDHRDRERNMEQITQQKGDNNNGTGFGNRPGHTRWPPTSQEFQFSSHGDTTRPHTPQAVCPLFAPADRNYGAAPKTPVYGLACSEGRGGLILEATHVYTDPGKYQVDAHFLDDLLGVVTGRWEAQVEVEELMQVTLGECCKTCLVYAVAGTRG
ncbi:hypothetical protein E2C01_060118 [Portunus trituberculatus]|uniref:Uncharacterized protein n=1 Tax=Portunus trituberculatus TaxID=210409 RepID=A0A5B7H8F0_PORTR|nr:hypothetical protein [Portunus trituberculatus]